MLISRISSNQDNSSFLSKLSLPFSTLKGDFGLNVDTKSPLFVFFTLF